MSIRSSYTKCIQVVGDYKSIYSSDNLDCDTSQRMYTKIIGYISSSETTRADVVLIEDFFNITFKDNIPKSVIEAVAAKKKEFQSEVLSDTEEVFVDRKEPVDAQYSTV